MWKRLATQHAVESTYRGDTGEDGENRQMHACTTNTQRGDEPALVVVAVATGALSGGGGADSDSGGRVPEGAESHVLMPVRLLCDACCALWNPFI